MTHNPNVRLDRDQAIIIIAGDSLRYKIRPTYCPRRKSAVIAVEKITSSGIEHLMTIDTGMWRAIARWLPVVINAAERMAARPSRGQ